MMISKTIRDEQYSEELKCANPHRLKQWEIRRYHEAVDAHRLELSRKSGRAIEWRKAEQDFHISKYNDKAESWRADFCSLICPKRSTCLMAYALAPMPEQATRCAA
ncbi:MAG: hypothetical protein KJN67_03625 [Pontiella sp.]|nr:hypothetical protein [Pontiella sp.]MBT8046237.1 hypothetical protein [Pontiella sp.]NNJ69953.1 hypothetical protein [Kiritimatiellales bacterium]